MKVVNKLFATIIIISTIIIVVIITKMYSINTEKLIKLEVKNKSITPIENCANIKKNKAVQQRGDYFVFTNYVTAARSFGCDKSITYTTPGDYKHLHNLVQLVERWKGPISVGLYAPGSDFQTTMDIISYLEFCTTPLIKQFVSFHLFFEWTHIPKKLAKLNSKINCKLGFPRKNKSYREQKKLKYPINIARNVAKQESQTHFVLAADIELYPSPNLIQNFFGMIKRKPDIFRNKKPQIFVLPLFELLNGTKIPNNKTELQTLYKNKKAFIFHAKLCLRCHNVPEGDKWMKEKEKGELDIFTKAQRTGKYANWEPFYIGTKDDPEFDDRLTWEGQSNKMTQGYLMCVFNYDYLVLNDAFLVHKPGIKKKKEQLSKFRKIVSQTNNLIKKVIKPQFDALYGKSSKCIL